MSDEKRIKDILSSIEKTEKDLHKIIAVASQTEFITPEGRGDKVWLYKGANQCASLIAKLEQIKLMREGKMLPISATQATQEKYEKQLIEKAEAEAEKLKQRLS